MENDSIAVLVSSVKAVVKTFRSGSPSVVLGFAVTWAMQHFNGVFLVGHWAAALFEDHKEGSSEVGLAFLALLGVAAVLFVVGEVAERRRYVWLDPVRAVCRWVIGRLFHHAIHPVCFSCGALVAFGAAGCKAAILMLVFYAGLAVFVKALVGFAEMPRA